MVKIVMVCLFPTSKTLHNFVNGHNMLGDEVYPCLFGIDTLVHDLRHIFLHFFKNWLFVT